MANLKPGVAWIERFFERLENAFSRASTQPSSTSTRAYQLANRTIRITAAGRALQDAVQPALEHLLPADNSAVASLDIGCWDEEATGVPLPAPPWAWPPDGSPAQLTLPADAHQLRLWVTPSRDALTLYHRERARAIVWVQKAACLPNHWHGSPFLDLFDAWSAGQGLPLLHAGGIGRKGLGLLLGGPGGVGKSTAALLGLTNGFDYVGDDYCLLEPGAVPAIHCIYSSGKLHRQQLGRFPKLSSSAIKPVPDEDRKPVVLINRLLPGQIAQRLTLGAIVLPHVSGAADTSIRSVSPGEAVRRLAPTSMLQLPEERVRKFSEIARLAQTLPCFRLEMGTDFSQVSPALYELLDELR